MQLPVSISTSRLMGLLLILSLPFLSAANAPTGDLPAVCDYNPQVADILAGVDRNTYADHLSNLTGAGMTIINGETTRISTRFTPAMFAGQDNARAVEYIIERLLRVNPSSQIEIDNYTVNGNGTYFGSQWANIVLTLPGQGPNAAEQVLLTAHLDSIVSDYYGNPWNNAPGAEDNGSGSVALLEAARVLNGQRLDRTVKLIWFTGEEQFYYMSSIGAYRGQGSINYVEDHDLSNVVGVFNLDMFGYDGNDKDRCFEIHAGTMPQSNAVGQCLADTISAYNLDLRYDYITSGALTFSDHASFWDKGVGAIEVLENFSSHSDSLGCQGRYDRNRYYHMPGDTIDNMDVTLAADISRAAIAAAARFAGPLGPTLTAPVVYIGLGTENQTVVYWDAVDQATGYWIYRSDSTCDTTTGSPIGEVDSTVRQWVDPAGTMAFYQVVAVDTARAISSAPSRCVSLSLTEDVFLPSVNR